MSFLTAHQLACIPEISVSFHVSVPFKERPFLTNSEQAYQVFLSAWDTDSLEYEERIYVLFLNKGNRVIGIHEHARGGRDQSLVDIGQVLAIGLKANASGIMLAHNHPSGNLTVSHADKTLTNQLKEASELLKLHLIDHLIISKDDYVSFADTGLL